MKDLIDLLKKNLRKGIVNFVYRKKDGTERHAVGTLCGIGKTIMECGEKEYAWTLRYYDLEKKGWRSFIIRNLISVGEVREDTPKEHQDICLALVVKLKEKMKRDGKCAFAYRNSNGDVCFAHGAFMEDENTKDGTFKFFNIDTGMICVFSITDFLSFGEREDIEESINEGGSFFFEVKTHSHKTSAYNTFSHSKIQDILTKNGIDGEEVKECVVIDLLPHLNKEQLRDLIIKATNRLAEL